MKQKEVSGKWAGRGASQQREAEPTGEIKAGGYGKSPSGMELTLLAFMLPWPRRPKWPVNRCRTVRFCLFVDLSLELVPLLPREFSIGGKKSGRR